MKKKEYTKLNVAALHSKKTQVISFGESVKDIVPIDWSKDVLEGRRKLEVTI